MSASVIDITRVRAVTLDLDDTLWPIWPTITRAEGVLLQWLGEHAPATATLYSDTAALRAIRNQMVSLRPDLRQQGRSTLHLGLLPGSQTIAVGPSQDRRIAELHPQVLLVHLGDHHREPLADTVPQHHRLGEVDTGPIQGRLSSGPVLQGQRQQAQGLDPEPGFIIAMLKRAQVPLNEALHAFDCIDASSLTEETRLWLQTRKRDLFELRREIIDLMHELRAD